MPCRSTFSSATPRCPTGGPASRLPATKARSPGIAPAIDAEARRVDRRARHAGLAALRRLPTSTWMRRCRSASRGSTRSGTLLEGIALWGELKPLLTHEAVIERALRYCDLAVSQGLLAIRTHVDVCDDRLLCAEALLEVKKRVAPYIDLQIVAFPQDGYYRSPAAAAESEPRARSGRRCGRRHPAFRAHHGGWRREPEGAVRDRGEARAPRRHPLRRDRRSAVAPRRGARLSRRNALACRAASSARISPRCIPWTTTTSRSSSR